MSITLLAYSASNDPSVMRATIDTWLPGPISDQLDALAKTNAMGRATYMRLLLTQDFAEVANVGINDRRLALYRVGPAPRGERGGVPLKMKVTLLQRRVALPRAQALGSSLGGYLGALVARAWATSRGATSGTLPRS